VVTLEFARVSPVRSRGKRIFEKPKAPVASSDEGKQIVEWLKAEREVGPITKEGWDQITKDLNLL
jgi:hypothetical protein